MKHSVKCNLVVMSNAVRQTIDRCTAWANNSGSDFRNVFMLWFAELILGWFFLVSKGVVSL